MLSTPNTILLLAMGLLLILAHTKIPGRIAQWWHAEDDDWREENDVLDLEDEEEQ